MPTDFISNSYGSKCLLFTIMIRPFLGEERKVRTADEKKTECVEDGNGKTAEKRIQ